MLVFPEADPNHAGFKLEVERGLRLRLAAQGLTGVAYIEADYADPQRNPPLEIDWQPSYPYVPSTRSRITQLGESVEKILRSLENVDIGRLVDGMEKSLGIITKVVENVKFEKLSGEAVALLSEVRDTNRELKNLVGGNEIKTALGDAAAAAKGAREIIGSAEKPIKQLLADLPQASESMTRLIKRLDSVANDLPETSTQLRQTIQRMNRLIANQQRDIERTMENLRAISDNMKEVTENSKKYPSQVLFGSPPPPSKAIQR
jgi:ABC-type transporter Mla subunit MlaD